jgi:hypothetical protein
MGMSNMTIAEKIKRYLESDAGMPYCDDCLKEELGLQHPEQVELASTFDTEGRFKRGVGICRKCGEEKTVSWVST